MNLPCFVSLRDSVSFENLFLKSKMVSSFRFFVSLHIFRDKRDNAEVNIIKMMMEKYEETIEAFSFSLNLI